jgi:hypothetical protein
MKERESKKSDPMESSGQFKGELDPSISTNWIKKLDAAMLKLGLSPKVAFLNADLNQNGVITIEELREALKNLLPDDTMSFMEIKQIARAFDSNLNGMIDEDEFIKQFELARTQPVYTR